MYEPYTPPPEHFNEAVLNWGEERPSGADGRILQATVAVIGAGFVGLHLIKAFSQRHRVIAYDIDDRRLMELTSSGVGEDVLCTSNPEELRSAEYFLIAVPTKVNHDNTINANAVQSAIDMVAQYANDGATIVIESSVAIGMTRELLTPAIHLRGFRGGMSPERVDPGRTFPKFHSIPKIVSGLDDISPGSLKAISSLYCTIFSEVVPVSCPEVAEMTKLYENCQRMINIAYANEMADACSEIGIDPFEVSRAAATKPFGYQPYTPSPGVGGHCIPVNPYYLLHNSEFPLLEAATRKTKQRPSHIADCIMKKRKRDGSSFNAKRSRPRILVVGTGFKRGQANLSNSPGVEMIRHLLDEYQAYVEFCDPLVSQEALDFVPRLDERSEWNAETIDARFDIVVVALDQTGLDMTVLLQLKLATVENYSGCLPWGVSCV